MRTLCTNVVDTKQRFYAVATNADKAKEYPEFSNLNWMPLKSKSCVWVNCQQVHHLVKEEAQKFYDLLKSKDMIVFKNW